MKVCRLDCPYCGANIEADVENRKIVYCTYCGNQIQIDNNLNNITINQNININQNVNQRVTNDAEILKEQNRHKENWWKLIITCMLLLVVGGASILFLRKNSNSKEETNINVMEENINTFEQEESLAFQNEEEIEDTPDPQIEDTPDSQIEEKNDEENHPSNDAAAYSEESISSNSLDKQPIEIVDSGYSVKKREHSEYANIYYAVKILNPNKEYAVRYPKLRITARSADGAILTTYEQRIRLIEAGETISFTCDVLYEGKLADSVEIGLCDEGTYFQQSGSNLATQDQFVISNVSVNESDYNRRFTGEVTNNSDVDLKAVFVAVIFKNNGKLIGGARGFVHNIKSGETLPFEVSDDSDIEYDSYEMYGLQWPE